MPSIVSDPVSKNNLVDLVSKILLQKILVNSSLHVYDNLTIFSNSRQFKNSFATLQLNSQHFHSMSLFYKGKNLKYFIIFVLKNSQLFNSFVCQKLVLNCAKVFLYHSQFSLWVMFWWHDWINILNINFNFGNFRIVFFEISMHKSFEFELQCYAITRQSLAWIFWNPM